MIAAFLLQSDGLTPLQRAVREHFQQGGSARAVFWIMLALLVAILFVRILSFRPRRQEKGARMNEPRQLFLELLPRLELTPQQQRFLLRLADDLRLPHPTVLVLSPALFDRYVRQWLDQVHRRVNDPDEQMDDATIARLRKHLFPEILSRVTSQQLRI